MQAQPSRLGSTCAVCAPEQTLPPARPERREPKTEGARCLLHVIALLLDPAHGLMFCSEYITLRCKGRRAFLETELEPSGFFTEAAMRSRNPVLHAQILGSFAPPRSGAETAGGGPADQPGGEGPNPPAAHEGGERGQDAAQPRYDVAHRMLEMHDAEVAACRVRHAAAAAVGADREEEDDEDGQSGPETDAGSWPMLPPMNTISVSSGPTDTAGMSSEHEEAAGTGADSGPDGRHGLDHRHAMEREARVEALARAPPSLSCPTFGLRHHQTATGLEDLRLASTTSLETPAFHPCPRAAAHDAGAVPGWPR